MLIQDKVLLVKEGQTLETDAQNLAELMEKAKGFVENLLALLLRRGGVVLECQKDLIP